MRTVLPPRSVAVTILSSVLTRSQCSAESLKPSSRLVSAVSVEGSPAKVSEYDEPRAMWLLPYLPP